MEGKGEEGCLVGGEGFKVLARRAGRTGRVVRLAGTDALAHTHTHTEKRLSRGGRPRHTPRKWTRQALDLTAGAAGLDGWGWGGAEESCIDFCVCCFGLFVCFFYSVNQI